MTHSTSKDQDGSSPARRAFKPKPAPTPEVGSAPGAPPESKSDKARGKVTAERLEEIGPSLCGIDEVAALLEVTPRHLRLQLERSPKLRNALATGRARGLEALRRAQLRLAQTSASLAMFLGRVYLAQSEHREVEPSDAIEPSEAAQRVRDKLAGFLAEAVATGRNPWSEAEEGPCVETTPGVDGKQDHQGRQHG